MGDRRTSARSASAPDRDPEPDLGRIRADAGTILPQTVRDTILPQTADGGRLSPHTLGPAGSFGPAVFLRSLTLKGFKSFAEATTLELEPGVTVVVGPNGSGKSNVVDAIAWVLGAQAPSAVRSQKMDDVIFAGTASRPALGRAEVSLTIDNSAGILPIEFSEVTVKRTLFRSGDSEYAINNVPCRLLDVQELLSDARVGRQQHVIVSQGQIDAVLNARPEDRRAIIEEAAGVLKYRKRKEKAERRLDATEANLLRLQDLLREVRRQLRPLERQAEAAKRHGELTAELSGLRVYVAGREIAALRTKLATLAETRIRSADGEKRLKSELAAPRHRRDGARGRADRSRRRRRRRAARLGRPTLRARSRAVGDHRRALPSPRRRPRPAARRGRCRHVGGRRGAVPERDRRRPPGDGAMRVRNSPPSPRRKVPSPSSGRRCSDRSTGCRGRARAARSPKCAASSAHDGRPARRAKPS